MFVGKVFHIWGALWVKDLLINIILVWRLSDFSLQSNAKKLKPLLACACRALNPLHVIHIIIQLVHSTIFQIALGTLNVTCGEDAVLSWCATSNQQNVICDGNEGPSCTKAWSITIFNWYCLIFNIYNVHGIGHWFVPQQCLNFECNHPTQTAVFQQMLMVKNFQSTASSSWSRKILSVMEIYFKLTHSNIWIFSNNCRSDIPKNTNSRYCYRIAYFSPVSVSVSEELHTPLTFSDLSSRGCAWWNHTLVVQCISSLSCVQY